jgi:hypothetical protein
LQCQRDDDSNNGGGGWDYCGWAQLRHELDQKNVSVEQQQSAHDVAMERFQHEISKLHEDSKRYKVFESGESECVSVFRVRAMPALGSLGQKKTEGFFLRMHAFA